MFVDVYTMDMIRLCRWMRVLRMGVSALVQAFTCSPSHGGAASSVHLCTLYLSHQGAC